LSTLVGPLAGALLLQVASWHAAFWINVPCAALAWAVLRRSPFGAPHGPRHRLDVAGAALLSAALVALLLATRRDLAPATLAAAVAAGIGLLLAWVFVERRAEDPILPLACSAACRSPATAAISAAAACCCLPPSCSCRCICSAALASGALGSALHTLPLMLGITVGAQLAGARLRRGASLRALGACGGSAALGFSRPGRRTAARARARQWALAAGAVAAGPGAWGRCSRWSRWSRSAAHRRRRSALRRRRR
jgi:hypothetical protein